jgi:hypothetical protein
MKTIPFVCVGAFLLFMHFSLIGFCQHALNTNTPKNPVRCDSTVSHQYAEDDQLILHTTKMASEKYSDRFSYHFTYGAEPSSFYYFHRPSWNSRLVFENSNDHYPLFRMEKFDINHNSSLDFNALSKQIKAPPLRFGNDPGNQQIFYPNADYQSIGWGYLLYEIFSHNYSNHMFNLYNGKR